MDSVNGAMREHLLFVIRRVRHCSFAFFSQSKNDFDFIFYFKSSSWFFFIPDVINLLNRNLVLYKIQKSWIINEKSIGFGKPWKFSEFFEYFFGQTKSV